MTEPIYEPPPPQTFREPVDPERALARGNMVFGVALFGLFALLFVGTVLVAFAYLAFD